MSKMPAAKSFNGAAHRRRSAYHPLRKIAIALAGIKHAVILDVSVAYKLIIAGAGLIIAAASETVFHFLFVLTVTGVMLVAEVFNTVVECLCDYLQPDEDGAIKNIKDMAAAATLIAILIWYGVLAVVFYEAIVGTDLFSRS